MKKIILSDYEIKITSKSKNVFSWAVLGKKAKKIMVSGYSDIDREDAIKMARRARKQYLGIAVSPQKQIIKKAEKMSLADMKEWNKKNPVVKTVVKGLTAIEQFDKYCRSSKN